MMADNLNQLIFVSCDQCSQAGFSRPTGTRWFSC